MSSQPSSAARNDSSMRRRAQAIDAELSIDGSSAGTQVKVAWQA